MWKRRSKVKLWKSVRKPGELLVRTTLIDYKESLAHLKKNIKKQKVTQNICTACVDQTNRCGPQDSINRQTRNHHLFPHRAAWHAANESAKQRWYIIQKIMKTYIQVCKKNLVSSRGLANFANAARLVQRLIAKLSVLSLFASVQRSVLSEDGARRTLCDMYYCASTSSLRVKRISVNCMCTTCHL